MLGKGYSDPARIAASVREASLAVVRSQLKPAVAAAYGQVKRQHLFPVAEAARGFKSETKKSKEELSRSFTGAAGDAAQEVFDRILSRDGDFYYGAIESIRGAGVQAPYAVPRKAFGV